MKRYPSLIILICALLVTVPFINKAFHIDDTFYLAMTKAILQDSTRPYSFWINWFEIPEFGFSGRMPPLFCYILSPVYALFGPSTIALHIVSILIFCMGVFAFFKLCKECDLDPLYPTLVYISVPLFSVGLNIMLDVPALSFSVMTILLMVRGKNHFGWYWGAGILLLAAILTKYSALTLIPPIIVYAWATRRPGVLIPAGVATLGFVFWNLYTLSIYGQMHFFSSAANPIKYYRAFLLHPIAFILVLGTFFPYAILCLHKGKALWSTIVCGVIATVALVTYWHSLTDIPTALLTGCGIFLGIALCIQWAQWLRSTITQPLTLFFASWVAMVIVMNLLAATFIAARNVLIMLPALIIPLFQWIQGNRSAQNRLRWLLLSMFLLSLALGYTDYRYANVYSQAAKAIAAEYPHQRIWYTGHWGWQFYAEQHGFQSLSNISPEPQPGDIVILPQTAHKQELPTRITQRLRPIKQLRFPLNIWPLRTQNHDVHAGFYATEIYRPPYALSLAPLETFDVYLVQ